MVSGDRVCNCEKGVGACASGLVWVCCFEKDIWSVCFQATHTRGLARAAAAYASASSACPDADGARKKSETPEPAGKSSHRLRRVEICLVENRGGSVYTAALSERLMDAEPVFTMLFCAARGSAMTSSASATQDLASSSLRITLLCASSSLSADFANVTVVEW